MDIRELVNKPVGSDAQVDAARGARDWVLLGEAVLTLYTTFSVGLLPPEFAATIIKAYSVQLIAAGMLAFGYLEPRLDRLREMKSQKSGN